MDRTAVVQRTKQGEFCWVDLVAKDFDAQTEFYEQLFDWRHDDIPLASGQPYRAFLSDKLRVAGIAKMNADMEASGLPSTWNSYIAAHDVDERVHLATGLGGQVVMPPESVAEEGAPQEGRMAGIQDPTGAVVFFWQPLHDNGAQKFAEPGALVWNDLMTRNPERAAKFYSSLFPWQIDRSYEGEPAYWQIVIDGMAEGGIMGMGEPLSPQLQAHWLAYFAVEDARSAALQAVALRGSVIAPPREIPGVTVFAVLADPEGAAFGIMQAVT